MAWRDFLPVHPAAELFPVMTPAEIKDLAADIKAHGLRYAITLWRDADGKYWLLDGQNRLDAWEVAGLRVPDSVEAILATLNATFLDAETEKIDPYHYVASINLRRRHLTSEQKRDLIGKLLKQQPNMSDRDVAKLVGASPTTVGDVRRELVEAGQLSKMDSRIGADGKSRKLPTPKPTPQEGSPQHSASYDAEQLDPEHRPVAATCEPHDIAQGTTPVPAQPQVEPFQDVASDGAEQTEQVSAAVPASSALEPAQITAPPVAPAPAPLLIPSPRSTPPRGNSTSRPPQCWRVLARRSR